MFPTFEQVVAIVPAVELSFNTQKPSGSLNLKRTRKDFLQEMTT